MLLTQLCTCFNVCVPVRGVCGRGTCSTLLAIGVGQRLINEVDDDRNNIRAGDRVVGIVSERDIVRILASRGAAGLGISLTDVMTRKVVSCEPSATVSAVMEQMTAGKFRHVPVIDGEKLVGIISIGDVVKLRLQEMEREQNALRDYIQTA